MANQINSNLLVPPGPVLDDEVRIPPAIVIESPEGNLTRFVPNSPQPAKKDEGDEVVVLAVVRKLPDSDLEAHVERHQQLLLARIETDKAAARLLLREEESAKRSALPSSKKAKKTRMVDVRLDFLVAAAEASREADIAAKQVSQQQPILLDTE